MYLSTENLYVRYGSTVVLDNLNLKVNKGELFGLIGPNGSGKTTCLKTIIGLLKPTGGRIFLGGKPIDPESSDLRKKIGYCPQQNSIFDRLTVKENIKYFANLYGQPNTENLAEQLSKSVNLANKKDEMAVNLSGGMKRRLNIACSIVHNPEVLLLDEPTVELDPFSRKVIWDLIKWINRNGTTVVLSTNSMEETRYLCHRIVFLEKGSAHLEGNPQRVLAEVQKRIWWPV